MAIKIYKLNDCDWFAAETLEEAIQCARGEFGYTDDSFDEAYELDDDELDRLQYRFTDDDDKPIGTMSFRAALAKRIAEGEQFPFIFASTEH